MPLRQPGSCHLRAMGLAVLPGCSHASLKPSLWLPSIWAGAGGSLQQPHLQLKQLFLVSSRRGAGGQLCLWSRQLVGPCWPKPQTPSQTSQILSSHILLLNRTRSMENGCKPFWVTLWEMCFISRVGAQRAFKGTQHWDEQFCSYWCKL